eukprot:TRINITY_DN40973_c0_g2_i1.p1 TRINITY_DN40973_c0_g2~~TRINITY_DN40973_c0_g2_i1.p1  ORF type:complete len:453 (+),score=94.53 TRINITY_DN40973_c0_g2_i1:116-1474(+)
MAPVAHRRCLWSRLLTLVAVVSCWEQGLVAEAMLQSGSIQIGGASRAHRWQYLTKFGYGLGDGTYSLKVRLQRGQELARNSSLSYRMLSLELQLFLDEDWEKAESLPACRRGHEAPARRTHYVDLMDGQHFEWSAPALGLVHHVMRPHIWYFAVNDCSGELGNQTLIFDYEFHAKQGDRSEFGFESKYMPAAEGVALLGLSALLLRVAYRLQEVRQSAGALHPVVWALGAAVACRYASHVANLVHLLAYRGDGVGMPSFDILAEVLFMTSQVIHATLLIAIAKGYTLLPACQSQLDISRLAIVATLAAHAALVGFDNIQEGTSARRHHDHGGFAGWAIAGIRLALLGWFWAALKTTKDRAGCRLQEFMQRFGLAGTLYFLSYPVIFAVVQVFAAYLRQPIMVVALLLVQAACDSWLCELFLTRGAYFKLSSLSCSFLPGGTDSSPVGLDKGA